MGTGSIRPGFAFSTLRRRWTCSGRPNGTRRWNVTVPGPRARPRGGIRAGSRSPVHAVGRLLTGSRDDAVPDTYPGQASAAAASPAVRRLSTMWFTADRPLPVPRSPGGTARSGVLPCPDSRYQVSPSCHGGRVACWPQSTGILDRPKPSNGGDRGLFSSLPFPGHPG